MIILSVLKEPVFCHLRSKIESVPLFKEARKKKKKDSRGRNMILLG